MMNTIHKSSFTKASFVLKCGAALLLGSALIVAQSRIVRPESQSNSNSGKRSHVTTLRSSDSPDGSRVAINSDQSLNDYEAYRRGDRFYVRIPAADVPRAEATRGRGFADVKVQRSGDSIVISFRLLPGSTAHVEQRSNRLDIVFTAPGAPRVSGTGPNVGSRDVARANPEPPSSKKSNAAKQPGFPRPSSMKNTSPASTKAVQRTSTSVSNKSASPSTGTGQPSTSSSQKPESKAGAETNARNAGNALASPTPKANATPTPKTGTIATASPILQPTPATIAGSSETAPSQWQNNLKERIRYWIVLAQLNPVPVSLGAGVLALLIGLFVVQRRRAKAARRVRPSQSKSQKANAATDAAPSSRPSAVSTPEADADWAVPAAAIADVVAATTGSKKSGEEAKGAVTPAAAAAASLTPDRGERQAQIAGVGEEVKNVIAGRAYDQNVIASDDRVTRRLVGAELLSALVGRNTERRERARAAFIKHGYFDDATRDLRTAETPVERAAAARRLSFVRDHEATPHLIAALDDSAPEVRRAAVEALMDARDPAAIGPLNSLMQVESDRKVPLALIKRAIESCATSAPDKGLSAFSSSAATSSPQFSSPPLETEREVIEL